jgi:hypothetical protein
MEEIFKKIKDLLIGGLLLFAFFNILPATAQAASLYFSPSQGSHVIGATFSVSVYVSSADQAINAASGIISFPADKLEVASLSKTSSIFSLWVQEPSFSNSAGTVNFEGIVLNPGFIGSSGKAITITFRTKTVGNAPLTFSSGSILANDGKGTNILTGLGDADFSLAGATKPKVTETITPTEVPAQVSGIPAAPEISSPTHPDPTKWYSNATAKFIWQTPADIIAARLLYDKYPNSRPIIVYQPAISEKEIKGLDDGVYYFHIQLKNKSGWGAIAHFKFQIDTHSPEPFTIKFMDGNETTNPRPVVLFDTTDSLSGIDYYRVKIGEGDFFNVAPEIVKSNPYMLPLQAPGKRTILVQAYDGAGNYITASEEFIINSIESPVFTGAPKELTTGEILKIDGKTKYPEGEILVYFQRENDSPEARLVRPDANGSFMAIYDERVKDGVYKIWAEVVDGRGARSVPSEKVVVAVKRPAFLRIGSWAVSFLAVVIPLVALIFLFLFAIWYGWYKFSKFRVGLRKEVREAESALHKAFNLLKRDIQEQIGLLEKTETKRQLTDEEEKIVKQLKKDLSDAERFVKKEIEDIEKKVD